MKQYHFFLLSMVIVLPAFVTLTSTNRAKRITDDEATHNMLVVGEKTIYLSHLPMFQHKGHGVMPHRYQAILEVSFDESQDSQGRYAQDRQSHPAINIYTISPEPFVLPMLVATAGQGGPLRSFKGNIFRGHLEKDGDSILSSHVQVKRVVYFKEFLPVSQKLASLEYLLFGKGDELFLAHLISAPPDFDQVLSVTLRGHSFTDTQLAKGIKLQFKQIKNSAATRLKEKGGAEGLATPDTGGTPVNVKVVVNREYYFEEGELMVPAVFETTNEEKKARFL
jgi:hypothetical protein